MSELSKTIGKRIRGYRRMQRLSQEQLAERCGLHPAYIGQLERGEKNATLESVQSVCRGLQIPLEQLFFGIGPGGQDGDTDIPGKISALVDGLAGPEQTAIYKMIEDALRLKYECEKKA